MTEAASSESPRELVTHALQTLDDTFDLPRYGVRLPRYGLRIAGGDPQLAVLATGLRAALAALTDLAASVGECQVDLPYASMQLVRHPDGSREWCCSHTPPHCDPA